MKNIFKRIDSILLHSENATNLANFYKEKVGLEITSEAEMGDRPDNMFEFKIAGGGSLFIVDHSELHGQNTQPQRFMINFETDDIEEDSKRLKDAGVKEIGQMHHLENYGLIATFEDIDGNYFQLVQTHEA